VNDDDTSTTTSFELEIIFLHHFSQLLCIVISLFIINDVRMTTFTHQLLSRKTSAPEAWHCECEHSSRSATCPSLCCTWAMQMSFSFN